LAGVKIVSKLVKSWIPIVFFAVLPGLMVLASYLMPAWGLVDLRNRLIEWAVIVAAFTFMLGIFNILQVHGRRLSRRRSGWFYSLVLVVAMALAMLPPIFSIPLLNVPESTWMWADRLIFDDIITPVGATLAALVAFVLLAAAFRLLRTRHSAEALLFLVVVIVTLLGTTPLVGGEWLADVRYWLITVPGMAGMRGLLLGVGLGIMITALRVFIGDEHPYTDL